MVSHHRLSSVVVVNACLAHFTISVTLFAPMSAICLGHHPVAPFKMFAV